jgi:hypothetical protein
VAEVLALDVSVTPDQPDTVRVSFAVRPVDDEGPLALALEVTL